MGNSQKTKGSGGKGKKEKMLEANRQAFLRRTGLTPADAGVAARRAISVTHGGIQAAEGIPGIKPLVWFSSHVRKRPSKNTLSYHSVRKYRDGSNINMIVNGSLHSGKW